MDFISYQRGFLRQSITKKALKIEREYASLTKIEKVESITFLKDSRSRLNKFNEEIAEELWKKQGMESDFKEHFTTEMERCEEYELKIIKCISLLETEVASQDAPVTSDIPRGNRLKLPELPLPEYSHAEGESLEHSGGKRRG